MTRRAIAFSIAAMLGCGTANADAPPELFASLPADVSWLPYADFVVGGAIGSGGGVVPAAYMVVITSPDTYWLWTTDGTAAGTHSAGAVEDPGQVLTSSTHGAFFIGHTDATGWQVFVTDGPESSAHALTHEPDGVSYMVGLLDDVPLIQRTDDVAGTTTFSKVDRDSGALTDVATILGPYVMATTNGTTVFAVREPGPHGEPIEISSFTGATQPLALPIPPPSTAWEDPHQFGTGTRLACFENFTQYSPQDHRQELYCSDGTADGTRRPVPPPYARGVLLLDVVAFWPVGDRLVFQGRADGESNLALWSTDGTDAGTVKLDDGSTWLANAPCTDDRAGSMYYIASNGFDSSLASTDGTPAGTQTIAPLPANAYCLGRGTATHHGGTTWMQIGTALYRTDGTAAGTRAVEGAPELSWLPHAYESRTIVAIGRWIVFAAPNADGTLGLWRIDTDPIFADGLDGAN